MKNKKNLKSIGVYLLLVAASGILSSIGLGGIPVEDWYI